MEKSVLPRENVAPTSCFPLKFDEASIKKSLFPILWSNLTCGLKPSESPIFVKDNEDLGPKLIKGYSLGVVI